jgi:hypothetical protein
LPPPILSTAGASRRCGQAAEGHFDGHVTATTLIAITLGTENQF